MHFRNLWPFLEAHQVAEYFLGEVMTQRSIDEAIVTKGLSTDDGMIRVPYLIM